MELLTLANLKYNFTKLIKFKKYFEEIQIKERGQHTQDQKKLFISKQKGNKHFLIKNILMKKNIKQI